MKLSLATLNYFPLQTIFDTVARHLLTQAKRSVNRSGFACQYRGPDGLMCAAGYLIADEEYDPEIEGHNSDDIFPILRRCGNLPKSCDLDRPRAALLGLLQNIHDERKCSEADPEMFWREKLAFVPEQMAQWVKLSGMRYRYRIDLSTKVLNEFPDYEKQFASHPTA